MEAIRAAQALFVLWIGAFAGLGLGLSVWFGGFMFYAPIALVFLILLQKV